MKPEDVANATASLVQARRSQELQKTTQLPADNVRAIGTAIRQQRKARRLHQSELAKQLGIGRRVVNEVENDRRPHVSATTLLRLAHAAGVRLLIDTSQGTRDDV